MSILFNEGRQFDGRKQEYPLFFGEGMGLHDVVDTTYPEIEELSLTQRSQFWTELEVDLSRDQEQWLTLDESTQDVSVLNLAWQSQADTIAGRAPIMALMPFVTNPEFEELLNMWQFFEQIHARSYQHIIRSVFPDPERVRDAVASNLKAMRRLDVLVREFENLHKLSAQFTLDSYDDQPFKTYTKQHYQKAIARSLFALYGLESVQFFSSFACTFALAERGVMSGVADILRLIAKDESLHTRFTKALLEVIRNDPQWADVLPEAEAFFHEVMKEICQIEYDWGEYLFSEGRSILGFNAGLIREYVDYLRTGAVRALNFSNDTYGFEVNKNPIPWIDKYLNPEKVQVAPQERNITNYRVGQVDAAIDDDDLGDFDIDF